jgi:MurNAc alpha-1-phosphate uridylyltransferase
MILAAGRGERLRPVTDETPKALVEVGGRTLLDRHLEHVASAGIREVVINLGWLGHAIEDYVGTGRRWGIDVAYSREGDNVLETGGGIYKALPLLGAKPFLVINADIYTEMPVPEVRLGDNLLAHLVVVPTPVYSEHGDFNLENGLIRRAERPTYTFAGVAVYHPGFFAGRQIGRFSVVPLLHSAADAGRLAGSVYRGPWADIGTPERLAALRDTL